MSTTITLPVNHGDAMPANVTGTIAATVSAPKPGDMDPIPLPTPLPSAIVSVTLVRTDAGPRPPVPLVAAVAGTNWTAPVPANLPDGIYVVFAVGITASGVPSSDSRHSIHKP